VIKHYHIASAILVLLISSTAALSLSCAKKTSTPDDWVAGMLSLTPAQSGKAVPVDYSILPRGDSIDCKVNFEQAKPGDSGTITWKLINAVNLDGDFRIKANLLSTPGSDGISSSSINIKLRCDGDYVMGSNSTQSSLESLVKYFDAQFRSLGSSQVVTYEIEWLIDGNSIPTGKDKTSGASRVNNTILEVTFQLTSNHPY
jgi:hypothetical protein